MAHYLATGEGPVLGKRLELPALRADGTEFPVELAITRIPTDGPPLFTAYLRDISEREAGRAASQRPARRDPRPERGGEPGGRGRPASCGRCAKTSAGTWASSGPSMRMRTALVCRQSWHRPDVPVDEFEAASCSRTFERGRGCRAGCGPAANRPGCSTSSKDGNFPRLATAVRVRPAQRLRLPGRRRRPNARRDRVLHQAHPRSRTPTCWR